MPSAEEFNYGYLHDVETAQVINVPWIAPDGEMELTLPTSTLLRWRMI
jgi:hypothetical protein